MSDQNCLHAFLQISINSVRAVAIGLMALGVLITCAANLPGQSKRKSAAGARRIAADQDDDAPVKKDRKSRRKKDANKQAEGVADYASPHFLVHTDLADEEAEDLLDRLETMLSLISKYWGRPASGVIEMFVVKDLGKWPRQVFAPEGLECIEQGAGITVTTQITNGRTFVAKSTVYAIADRGTPQHEAVHAYCHHTFGRTGPVWYSEGMAEMGQYWRNDNSNVSAHPAVIQYLRESEPKTLDEIVNAREFTGDSWQNYAWRWALCHLLASNTNYAPRFRLLGLGLLTKDPEASFEQTYGDMAREISFEYRQFLQNLETGCRADLCSWDWKAKFKLVKGAQTTTVKIDAARGWQPARLIVMAGQEYEYSAAGMWYTAADAEPVDPDGNADGAGRLVGALLTDEGGDYKLSEPFELGRFGSLTAPGEGNLYLRCREGWAGLADNRGNVTVKLKLKGKGAPLAPPKNEPDKKKPTDKKPTAKATSKDRPADEE